MNCARSSGGDEDEEEEALFLDSPNFSRELAVKVKGFGSENELLEYLVEEKPPDLQLGREHYLDTKELEEYMEGLCLKLDINGHEDRAKRLGYLFRVLKAKFINKETVFKIVTQFLIDVAQRPTAVTQLEVSCTQYSCEPDEEENSNDEDSEKQKALLKEILGGDDEDNLLQENSYPSGDSLSEWSDDDNEDLSIKSNNDLPPGITRPVRTSSSFGEFSDICPEAKKPDPETVRKEAEKYWREEKIKADEYLESNIRKCQTFLLDSQPVISHRLVLHARFGEFWEWKRQAQSHLETHLQVAFVEDVVREVLWQFVISQPELSPVFNLDWTVKSDLMIASLSRSTFGIFINKIGVVMSKLENLRRFSSDVMSNCDSNRSTTTTSNSNNDDVNRRPSKVFCNYAAALQDISIFIMEGIDHIERELKRLPRDERDDAEPGCTTFVQLERQTRSFVKIIELVHKVHSKSLPSISPPVENGEANPPTVEEEMPWLASVKLISWIEAHLILETQPSHHGVLLFLYTKCLFALIDEIMGALKTLKWDERYSLFVRDSAVGLNDPDFWSNCIKIREFPFETFSSIGKNYVPLRSVRKLLPKVLSILKTCEVFDQLEEDFTQILGDSSKISVEALIQDFLEESLKPLMTPAENLDDSSKAGTADVDFFKHFDALDMGSSLAANCFRFLENPDFIQAITPSKNRQKSRPCSQQYNFADFFQLPAIPTKAHELTLDKVLCKWFDPFCLSAKLKIENIFQEYKVLERMTVFQEIILAVREDFARGIILIASRDPPSKSSQPSEYHFEETLARNSRFQRLLNECYPPEIRGDSFTVDLKLDRTSDMNCTFEVSPKFPLNLIVSPQSVAGYLFIGRQLHRIRKSLWNVSSLSMKTCCTGTGGVIRDGGVDSKRLLIFRFCLINFCSSLRSFFMLKVFSRDFADHSHNVESRNSPAASPSPSLEGTGSFFENDLDYMRNVHENYLDLIQTKMLRHPLIENVLLRKMTVMSESLRKFWIIGMSQSTMLQLEDTLKKCWQVVNDFESIKFSTDFNQLSWHFGPPPSYLTY